MKQKVDPLVEFGHKVFVSYDNDLAFESRKTKFTSGKFGNSATYHRVNNVPTAKLASWLKERCGPHGILWLARKGEEGFTFYFAKKDVAVLAKLTWGGS